MSLYAWWENLIEEGNQNQVVTDPHYGGGLFCAIIYNSRSMIHPQSWFTDRVGTEVTRNGVPFLIKNESVAKYLCSLQPYYTFNQVVIHTPSEPTYCLACEG